MGSLEEILTKLIGHHTLRFGFEGNLIRYNVQNPQSGSRLLRPQPGFAFDRRFTQKNSVNANVGTDANSGNPMASLMLGYIFRGILHVNIAYALQQIYMAPFIQDDWRATERLTLNLGLRWDYESPFTERYNRRSPTSAPPAPRRSKRRFPASRSTADSNTSARAIAFPIRAI